MPRDGAIVLSDVRRPTTLSIVCEPCGRRGTYNVARLMERHGDAKLPDLLQTLANCQKARSASIHDRCRGVFEQLPPQRPFGAVWGRYRPARSARRLVVMRTSKGLLAAARGSAGAGRRLGAPPRLRP
jgi:hypothetical protein